MIDGARFVHANLVARDWRRLAAFYQSLFGCTPVPPERDLRGDCLDRATGIPGAHIRGMHLRLPGHGEAGPTLEIFQYDPTAGGEPASVNRPGYGHLAFRVADVGEALAAVRQAGGGSIGDVVQTAIPSAGTLTFVYATDPEGNVIELQQWSQ